MWSYSQWVMERTCGLWTPRVSQKSKYTDRHLSLITLHDTQLSSLKYVIRLDMLVDQTMPSILQWLSQHVDHGNDAREKESNRVTFSDDVHQSTFHTPAGRIRLNYVQVKALAEMLAANNVVVPRELTEVLEKLQHSRRSLALSLPTNVRVTAFKRLLINDMHVDQALFNACIRSKRFEPFGSRDATFARFYSGAEQNEPAFFGHIDFFFVYKIDPCPENPDGTSLMIVCFEPIRVSSVEGMCRIYGGDPTKESQAFAQRRVEMADADEVVALLGVGYCAEKAFFVHRDSCYL
jgi:hypothetical protein